MDGSSPVNIMVGSLVKRKAFLFCFLEPPMAVLGNCSHLCAPGSPLVGCLELRASSQPLGQRLALGGKTLNAVKSLRLFFGFIYSVLLFTFLFLVCVGGQCSGITPDCTQESLLAVLLGGTYSGCWD